jgi:NAD+ synthase
MSLVPFSKDLLEIDYAAEVETIIHAMRAALRDTLKRRGLVIAMSGGIDSSVCAALAVRAVGPERVFGLLMPEQDSSSETKSLGKLLVEHLKIPYAEENITPILSAIGCYSRRDEAIRSVIPEFKSDWTCKIVLPTILTNKPVFRAFSVVVRSPDGQERKERLPIEAYLGIVAATNFKQRTRKTLEYYHADRLNYAVIGTPNRLEYDQGFFVKGGDGLADIKPIAHLYKTQVYAMARHLDLPDTICSRKPTTDTYSMPQGQDEFYFSLPYDKMDLCLYGKNNGFTPEQIAPAVGITSKQVQLVFDDIEQKRKTTRYLHLKPVLVESVFETE